MTGFCKETEEARPIKRALSPGVYTPLPTFFDDDEELDLDSYRKHLLETTRAGGKPVCAGSLGEAVHLTPEERIRLISFTRKTLDAEPGLVDVPIVAGVGGASTRESVALARDAARAGADAGMVILPAYYAQSLSSDTSQIVRYYHDICHASPIPILLYNFPANSAGQDMSSDTIAQIILSSPGLCGVKLTCSGNIGKLIRLKSALSPILDRKDFLFLDGFISDWTAWQAVGGHGTVSGLSNFAPRTVARLWHLLQKQELTEEETRERDMLQAIMSQADTSAVPMGVRGMKYILSIRHGYSVNPRRPLLPLDEEAGKHFLAKLQPVLAIEDRLKKGSSDVVAS
ncbi:putative dihydrodipicolinate synthase [Acaromyces ingoldii]|uniref:Putative dihydrodipicolinate synthase n=1 Tax=Acaromyces ingoldii TaxID=215250 RepID=A0A316YJN0_9BASI|nr:putative dihydrodipicolinate synthase [Acaromyces ingoldii]PWN88818.1 putative dihydrodipicolinate synthase [Acaromyces ingoldii]